MIKYTEKREKCLRRACRGIERRFTTNRKGDRRAGFEKGPAEPEEELLLKGSAGRGEGPEDVRRVSGRGGAGRVRATMRDETEVRPCPS